MTEAKITIRRLDTPPGDDRLQVKGTVQLPLPVEPTLDPPVRGVRIILYDAANTVLLDAHIPPNPFDPLTQRSWTVNATGNAFTYRQRGRTVPFIAGIKKVAIRDRSIRVPGEIKFVAIGQDAGIANPVLPVRATLILDPPVSGGQCAEAVFPGPPLAAPTCNPPVAGYLLCK